LFFSGDVVWDKVVFDAGDHILEQQLSFFQAFQLQLVNRHIGCQALDNLIKIAMLDAQLLQSQSDFRFRAAHSLNRNLGKEPQYNPPPETVRAERRTPGKSNTKTGILSKF
jgi:hypothetical protein